MSATHLLHSSAPRWEEDSLLGTLVAAKTGRRARPRSPSIYRIAEQEKSKLSGLDMPVLLVWGDRDRVFPLDEYGKPLKETLPRAKLLIIKQAGHGAYLDKPDEFNGLLLEFLSEVM